MSTISPRRSAAWYGGGPKLSRTVIVQGEETFVEVAPPIFRVQTAARPTAVMPVSLSKQAPVRELKRRAVEALRLSPAEADALVMVSVFDGPETRVLDQPDVSIEDARCVAAGTDCGMHVCACLYAWKSAVQCEASHRELPHGVVAVSSLARASACKRPPKPPPRPPRRPSPHLPQPSSPAPATQALSWACADFPISVIPAS